ncbi:MAG: hypothetical protein MJZ07_09620 [Bacteroidales bacterium]|nr:hypothetical protein [Bacteroidales bacterium]
MFPEEYFNYGLLRYDGSNGTRVDVYSDLYHYRSIPCACRISRASWVGHSILVEFEGCNYGHLFHDWISYDRVYL